MKRTLLVIIMVLLSIPLFAYADSGFDSSYSSGGSSGWSSSSSSSSWSSSSSSSYDGEMSDEEAIIAIIFFIMIMVVFIIVCGNSSSNKGPVIPVAKVNDEDLKRLFGEEFDTEKFLEQQYNAYVRIQEAWMNKDIDKVSGVLDSNLYNQYQTQILTLINANQINVMSDFKYNDSYIIDAKNVDGNKEITTILKVTVKDYVTDNDGALVKGHTNLRHYTYKMIYKSSSDDEHKFCPDCGAPLEKKSSQKCKYCGSTINMNTTSWVLVKKEFLKED